MANRVIVKHAMIVYRDEDGAKRTAMRGAEVEVTDDELARLVRHDAVVAADDEAAADVAGTDPVRLPLTPDEVGAAGSQAPDAGSDEQVGKTAEDVDPAADGTEDDAAAAASTRSSSRRKSSA